MSIGVRIVDEVEGPTIRQRPARKFYFGRFAPGSSYGIPESVSEKYNGICCLIRGGADSPNEETFDAMHRTLETVAGVGVHRVIFPAASRNGPYPHDVHYLIIVGDVEKGLEALKQNTESYIELMAFKTSAEHASRLRATPVRDPAANMALYRLPSKFGANL